MSTDILFCILCLKQDFQSVLSLARHLLTQHLSPDDLRAAQEESSAPLESATDLERHIYRQHVKKEPEEAETADNGYTCKKKCPEEKTFNTLGGLRRHTTRVHKVEAEPEAGFPCSQCPGKSLPTLGGLRRHMTRIHKQADNEAAPDEAREIKAKSEARFPCLECPGKSLPTLGGLKRHMSRIHKQAANEAAPEVKAESEAAFQCFQCPGKTLPSLGGLRRHMTRVHNMQHQLAAPRETSEAQDEMEPVPNLQDICIASMSTQDSKAEQPDTYECSQCPGKILPTLGGLRRHMTRLHKVKREFHSGKGESEADRMTCDRCPRVFHSVGGLRRHKTRMHKQSTV